MAEFTDNHIDLLTAVYDLASRIEQTTDPAKIAEYVDQLSRLKAKLLALGKAKKAARQL